MTITLDELHAIDEAAAANPRRPVCHECGKAYVSATGVLRVHRALIVVGGLYDQAGRVLPRIAVAEDDCPGSRAWPAPIDPDLVAFIAATPRVQYVEVLAERAERTAGVTS